MSRAALTPQEKAYLRSALHTEAELSQDHATAAAISKKLALTRGIRK